MSDEKKFFEMPVIYEGNSGEALTETQFIAQAEAMPEAHKCVERGVAYNTAALRFYMEHGSPRLRKQLRQKLKGKRRTLDPACLVELNRLGTEFDAYWLTVN